MVACRSAGTRPASTRRSEPPLIAEYNERTMHILSPECVGIGSCRKTAWPGPTYHKARTCPVSEAESGKEVRDIPNARQECSISPTSCYRRNTVNNIPDRGGHSAGV